MILIIIQCTKNLRGETPKKVFPVTRGKLLKIAKITNFETLRIFYSKTVRFTKKCLRTKVD